MITDLSGDWIGAPSIVRMVTTDNYATVTATGYITSQLANIQAINGGPFEWTYSDFVLCWLLNTAVSPYTGAWTMLTISTDFTSLNPYVDSFDFPVLPSQGGTGVVDPAAHGILVGEGASPFSSFVLTNGQLLIGSSGLDPVPAQLSAGSGISIANAAGSITITANGGSNSWVDETGSSMTMVTNTGYTSDDGASLVTFTLPSTSSIGDWVEVNGKGSGLWKIAQSSGQQIFCSSQNTTLGTSGSLTSVNQYDNVRLRCLISNTIWTVVSQQSTGLIYI